jgi:cell division protein FtsW
MANVRREPGRREYTIEPGKRKENTYDYTLLFLALVLICFGFVMIYSSSSYIAQIKEGDAAYYVKRQMLAAGLGLIVMIFLLMVKVLIQVNLHYLKMEELMEICSLKMLILYIMLLIIK